MAASGPRLRLARPRAAPRSSTTPHHSCFPSQQLPPSVSSGWHMPSTTHHRVSLSARRWWNPRPDSPISSPQKLDKRAPSFFFPRASCSHYFIPTRARHQFLCTRLPSCTLLYFTGAQGTGLCVSSTSLSCCLVPKYTPSVAPICRMVAGWRTYISSLAPNTNVLGLSPILYRPQLDTLHDTRRCCTTILSLP